MIDYDLIDEMLRAELDNQAAIQLRLRKPEPVALEPVEVKPLPTIDGPLDVRSSRI